MNRKYKPKKLFFIRYDYNMWSQHEEVCSDKDVFLDLFDMPPL